MSVYQRVEDVEILIYEFNLFVVFCYVKKRCVWNHTFFLTFFETRVKLRTEAARETHTQKTKTNKWPCQLVKAMYFTNMFFEKQKMPPPTKEGGASTSIISKITAGKKMLGILRWPSKPGVLLRRWRYVGPGAPRGSTLEGSVLSEVFHLKVLQQCKGTVGEGLGDEV